MRNRNAIRNRHVLPSHNNLLHLNPNNPTSHGMRHSRRARCNLLLSRALPNNRGRHSPQGPKTAPATDRNHSGLMISSGHANSNTAPNHPVAACLQSRNMRQQ